MFTPRPFSPRTQPGGPTLAPALEGVLPYKTHFDMVGRLHSYAASL